MDKNLYLNRTTTIFIFAPNKIYGSHFSFCSTNDLELLGVRIVLDFPTNFVSFNLKQSGDMNQNPQDWSVAAKTSAGQWVAVYEVTGFDFNTVGEEQTFAINPSGTTDYFQPFIYTTVFEFLSCDTYFCVNI